MTFDEAVLEANEQGWYIYQLCQEDPSCPNGLEWSCTLRALEGGYRRQISHGRGETWIEAIANALLAAPEPEREVSISTVKEKEMKMDLLSAVRAKLGPAPTIPRRRL